MSSINVPTNQLRYMEHWQAKFENKIVKTNPKLKH